MARARKSASAMVANKAAKKQRNEASEGDAESRSTGSRSFVARRRAGPRAGAIPSVGGRSLARPLTKFLKTAPTANTAAPATPAALVKPEVQLHPGLANLQAIVVNLERREDRMQGCTARLHANCPWLQHSRFLACDGRITKMNESDVVMSWATHANVVYQKKRAIRKGWDDLDTYKERHLTLSPGERGCAVSHIRAWQHCLEQSRASGSEQPLLVLEDDAAPTPEFTQQLSRAFAALPSDAHVLYLGYSQAADWRREISPELVESEYVWTTVAYIIWPAGARLLLSKLPVDQPVDNWMAAQCATGELKSYCVRPKIVHQADAWNVNSDVGHSDEHYWGPCSDIRHSDEFYWGPEAEHDGEFLQRDADETKAGNAPARGCAQPKSLFWNIDSEDSDESMD